MTEHPHSGGRLLARSLLAEFLGTAFLLAAVVGSGIMATRMSPDDGVRLLANSVATGAMLVALVLTFGSVSGAHLNPAVSVADAFFGGIGWAVAAAYCVVQVVGGMTGVVLANLMFELDAVSVSGTDRLGAGTFLAEIVATAGLLLAIFGTVRSGRTGLVPFVVGGYITAAYWFTSSTSFANPAVTISRTLSDTFAGIAPWSVPGFLAAQVLGALLAISAIAFLFPDAREVAPEVTQPHRRVD